MQKYFNPVNEIYTVGRPVGAFSYDALLKQLNPQEELLYGRFQQIDGVVICPCLSSVDVYQHFECNSISAEYFAVKKSVIQEKSKDRALNWL